MKRRRELHFYELSEKCGIEMYFLEVGRQLFIPRQFGTAGGVRTLPGETRDWMMAALERPAEPLQWTHTHPGMGAFFSSIDVEGSHELRSMVNGPDVPDRPIHAVVLGREGGRHYELLTAEWAEKNPKPEWPKPKWDDWKNKWRGRDSEYDEWRYHSDDDAPGRGYLQENLWDEWEEDPGTKVMRLVNRGPLREDDRLDIEGTVDMLLAEYGKNRTVRAILWELEIQYGKHKLLKLLDQMGIIKLVGSRG